MPNYLYLVENAAGRRMTVSLAENMKLLNVRLTPGDEVMIEISGYNTNRGRILKKN